VSRIGKKPIVIPQNVKVKFENDVLSAKGPKGELTVKIPNGIELKIEDNVINLSRSSDEKKVRSMHGLIRSLAANVVEGVANGFTKTLQIEGVGYKTELRGKKLLLNMGYSHPLLVIPPDGITLEAPNPVTVKISGIDKQLVGAVAAKIRKIRPPEPYKGKGIRYEGEHVRRKAGKTATK
jgi:large subunit ribosomal protein L6